MKKLLVCGFACMSFAGMAFADEAIVAPAPGPAPVVVEHRSDADMGKKVIVHKGNGCTSKTVKKSDEDNDTTVSKTVSNC